MKSNSEDHKGLLAIKNQKSTNLNNIIRFITFADFPDAGCLISKVSGRNHQTENINKKC